jgi:hypothetical protein
LKTTREIIAANGLPGLWRGTAASLARFALHHTVFSQLVTEIFLPEMSPVSHCI